MRYIDTGSRDPEDALATWLLKENAGDVAEFRLQSGYFSINGLVPFVPVLEELARQERLIRVVIGSNDCDTLAADVALLCEITSGPSATTQIALAICAGGLFHPKAYHLRRKDDSQAAYVGSANLTPAGIGGLNIEAGVLTDTKEGDNGSLAESVAESIDAYFSGERPFVRLLSSAADIDGLVGEGLLRAVPRVRQANSGVSGTSTNRRPRLVPLVQITPLVKPSGSDEQVSEPSAQTATTEDTDAAEQSDTETEATSGESATTAPPVLISEIGAGPRWKQANFPIGIIQDFFEVDAGSHIDLIPVEADGSEGVLEQPPFVPVKSQNYRFELASVSGITYPDPDSGRPIGVFVKDAYRQFRYRVLLPHNAGHTQMSALLAREYSGPSHHLKRIVTDLMAVRAAWTEAPF